MQKVLFFLGELDAGDIDWFIAVGEKRHLKKGDIIINKGKVLDALYILLQGELSVSIDPEYKREIARLQVGDIVGELSFLDARMPNANVGAATDSVVLALPRELLEDKLATEMDFASRFYRAIGVLLASRLRKTVSHLGFTKNQELESDDSVDPDRLDGVSLAGAWFDFIIRKLITPN